MCTFTLALKGAHHKAKASILRNSRNVAVNAHHVMRYKRTNSLPFRIVSGVRFDAKDRSQAIGFRPAILLVIGNVRAALGWNHVAATILTIEHSQ
jgi:hypothetical protein